MTSAVAPSLFQHLIEAMAEAVIVSDRAGMIVYWNHGAEQMFRYSAAEAVGQTLDLIIPEPYRARHWEGYRKVMASGITRYGAELLAVPAIRKDGGRISLEFSIAVLRDDTGAISNVAAIIRNVTAQWERDQLRKSRGP
jgi:PAS domain S-box-containing protein